MTKGREIIHYTCSPYGCAGIAYGGWGGKEVWREEERWMVRWGDDWMDRWKWRGEERSENASVAPLDS